MKKILLSVFLTLLTTLAFSQTFNKAGLDSLLTVLEQQDKFMGSIAISQNGSVIYSRALGYANVSTNQKATIESKYRIGSISKVFTSTLIFKAVEENKLKLDQTLDHFFPTVKNAKKIKIENLVNHRSGIHNFTDDQSYQSWMLKKQSEEDMVKIISDSPIDFEPDSKAAYSNSNYVLLGYILEKIYKKPLRDILYDKIVKPLKLKSTYIGDKINVSNQEVNSYTFTNSWTIRPETDMSIPAGAGAVVSTPSDLNIFFTSLLEGKIINQASLTKMKTLKEGYGMGIFPYVYHEQNGFGHNGGIDGFSSLAEYFPKDRLALAITSNGNSFSNNTIIISALNAFYGKPVDIPNFKKLSLKTEDLDTYLGEYSSTNFPLKITVTKKENVLIAQATGQGPFALEAVDKDIFEFAAAGIFLEFKPIEKQMTLKQGGATYKFTKP